MELGLLEQIEEKVNKTVQANIYSKTNKKIRMTFEFDKNNLNLVENIEVDVEKENTATVYIIYKQDGNEVAFHNGLIRVHANENSKVNVIVVNLMNDSSCNILSIDNQLENQSSVKYTIVDFGGRRSITNLYSNLEGKESNNDINCIYLGKNDDLLDLNYIGELYGEKSNINIEVQGALKDRAIKHFKGIIDFKKGCKKAKGNENEACMLLSDTAKSLALPMLLCSEEDVERKSFFK